MTRYSRMRMMRKDLVFNVIGKDDCRNDCCSEPLSQHVKDMFGKDSCQIMERAGLDLKVGGEGMKGFYDEILPATVNRLVKKHGGRVQQGEVAQMTEV